MKVAYHVAESKVRSSIQKYGLDPNKYYGDRTTSGTRIYLFLNVNEAVMYAKMYNSFLQYQGEQQQNFDIWKVDITSIKIYKDFTLNTGDDPRKDSAYYTKEIISPNKIKLYKTIK